VFAACPHLRIVATSRERLGVDHEHTFSISPLEVPDASMHRTAAGVMIVEDQFATALWKRAKTSIEARQAAFVLMFVVAGVGHRLIAQIMCRQRAPPAVVPFERFQEDQPRDFVAVGSEILDVDAFVELLGKAVERLVRVLVRKRCVPPLEEADQRSPELFVSFTRPILIGIQFVQQLPERLWCQRRRHRVSVCRRDLPIARRG